MPRLFAFSLAAILCLSHSLNATPQGDGREFTRGARDNVVMPKQCQPGKTSAEALGWRWKRGTKVRIQYLQDNFTTVEVAALSRAVNNWNAALSDTDSDVLFLVDEGEADNRTGASILVQRGAPRGRDRVGELRLQSVFNGKVRLSLTISPVVTDLEALTSLMTHEIGHSLGLADCYECRRGTTAMAAFKSKNKGNEVFQPSDCDLHMVAVGYAIRSEATGSLSRLDGKND
ncbi:MAG: hypothetical protein QOD75_3223 [Blastocatellia bacterium]|jgi:hypothetical protein|nr:hypothetical protein [Blastocatellia bacterium]